MKKKFQKLENLYFYFSTKRCAILKVRLSAILFLFLNPLNLLDDLIIEWDSLIKKFFSYIWLIWRFYNEKQGSYRTPNQKHVLKNVVCEKIREKLHVSNLSAENEYES